MSQDTYIFRACSTDLAVHVRSTVSKYYRHSCYYNSVETQQVFPITFLNKVTQCVFSTDYIYLNCRLSLNLSHEAFCRAMFNDTEAMVACVKEQQIN